MRRMNSNLICHSDRRCSGQFVDYQIITNRWHIEWLGGGGVGGGSSTGSGVGVGDGRVRHSTTTGTSSENDSDSTGPGSAKKLPLEKRTYYESPDVYCKTLRLTSEQIVRSSSTLRTWRTDIDSHLNSFVSWSQHFHCLNEFEIFSQRLVISIVTSIITDGLVQLNLSDTTGWFNRTEAHLQIRLL